jgi:hypothetical protein
MPKSRSKRTSAREYVKETPSHIVRIIERVEDALSEASDEPRRALIDVAVHINDDAAEPRLPVLARNQLRRELRKHPEAKRHVAGLKDTIDRLSKPARGKGMASVLEPEELEKWEHTLKYPAFVGLMEFGSNGGLGREGYSARRSVGPTSRHDRRKMQGRGRKEEAGSRLEGKAPCLS